MTNKVSVDLLKRLEPMCSMSDGRLQELAQLCHIEAVKNGADPFRGRGTAGQSVYLLDGTLELVSEDGITRVLSSGDPMAKRPLASCMAGLSKVFALTDAKLVRIDDDLLDVIMTWDQMAGTDVGNPAQGQGADGASQGWAGFSGLFSVSNLKCGAFAQLPSAHIEQLLKRFRRWEVRAGEVIIREGTEGDYYYVVESGRCTVERLIGGVKVFLAELKGGDAFGEEALVSDAKRNATVTMKTDGVLLRLDKRDFVELLREPLLMRVSNEDARQKIVNGGQWIDVRYPSEYQFDKLPGAINIPLAEIRNAFGVLEKSREYVVYCQSERRSAAAAFLLAQQGYKAFLLDGGLWGGRR